MAFTVRDFHSLVRLLEQRPEWRAQLRRLLLSQELLRLPRLVRQLSADVQKLQQATAELVEAQKGTERRLQRLEDVVAELVGAVGALKGENLERRYRERAASYFQRVLRRIRVVDHQQLGLLLDDALDQGRITPDDRAQVLEADVVLAGLADG
ncbi:MAG: hypothetical protein QN185_03780, partial [Armatimonadota bacterium]|nr:hypothetical protein [Armatimonadota bacterium]